ncbi:hypothetical protein N9N28_12735 [Rubripirellula amarantea]|nr:hypothetical protein [Rubripirellula amarantea]
MFWRRHREPRRVPPNVKSTWVPMVRVLEPRLVLNASAELNPLGQLLISGTNSADFVQLAINVNDELILRDQGGDPIPIANHPDGSGFETNPLDLDDITSKLISIDLGDGDDDVVMRVVPGINVQVAESGGTDTTTLQSIRSLSPDAGRLRVDTENIELSAPASTFRFGNTDTRLTGNVSISDPATTFVVQADAPLAIEGTLTLDNDLTIRGNGSFNLSAATLSASQSSIDFQITLPQGEVRLGEVNETAGSTIENLTIESASAVRLLGNEVIVNNEFIVRDVESLLRTESSIDAEFVSLTSNQQITLLGDIDSALSTSLKSEVVIVGADIASTDGDITIHSGQRFELIRSATLSTADAGLIRIDGGGGTISTIDGHLVDTGTDKSFVLTNASEVSLGSLSASDGTLKLGALTSPVGTVDQAAGSPITVSSIEGVISQDLNLRNTNNQIGSIRQLSVAGNVNLNDAIGDLFIDSLVVGGTEVEIVAAGVISLGRVDARQATVRFQSDRLIDAATDQATDIFATRLDIDTQTGMNRSLGLELEGVSELAMRVAQGNVFIESLGDQLLDLTNVALQNGSFELIAEGNVDVSQVDLVSGDANIRTTGDLSISRLNASAGEVWLDGLTINDAESDELTDITATRITLAAINGIGDQRIVEIDQATELISATDNGDIRVDSLTPSLLDVTQTNAGSGLIQINAAGDLFARQIDSAAGRVTLKSLGSLSIGTIEATDGLVNLSGNTIDDAATDDIADVVAGQIEFDASEGIGSVRSIEIKQASSLSAVTATGDIDLISLSTNPLVVTNGKSGDGSIRLQIAGNVRTDHLAATNGDVSLVSGGSAGVGSIEALAGTIEVTSLSINDAQNDTDADLTAANVVLNSEEGIGNQQAIEIDDASILVASTVTGNVAINSLGFGPIDVTLSNASDGTVEITAIGDVYARDIQSAGGEVSLTALGGISIEEIQSLDGEIILDGLAVNDAMDDEIADLVAQRITINAVQGIGNDQTIEVDQAKSLTTTTQEGNIQLQSLGVDGLVLEKGTTGDGSVSLLTRSDLRVDELTANNGDVRLIAGGLITVGSIEASSGTIELTATSINDAQADLDADLTATNIILTADQGIGEQRAIEIDGASVLTATTTSGEIEINSLGSSLLDVTQTIANEGPIRIVAVGDVRASQVSSTLGDISIQSQENIFVGSIDSQEGIVRLDGKSIDDATNDQVADIFASRVDLTAEEGIGSEQTIEIDQVRFLTAATLSGNIQLVSLGSDSLVIEDAISGNGSVEIVASSDVRIDQIIARGGDVSLTTTGTVDIGSIEASTGTIELLGASINDNFDDLEADLVAVNVVLTADTGIGNVRAVELDQVSFLTAKNTSGDVNLRSLGQGILTMEEVSTSIGSIDIVATGTVVAEIVRLGSPDATGMNTNNPCSISTTDVDENEIQITLTGLNSDLLVGNISAFGEADVTLTVGDDIRHIDAASVDQRVIADDLKLLSFNRSDDTDSGIELRTTVNQLVASISGANPGDLTIVESDSICLASSDEHLDSIVETGNGLISVTAANAIHVIDHANTDQDSNLKGDPELVANGAANGSVFLIAPSVILDDNVQIHGFKDVMSLTSAMTRNSLDEPTLDSTERAISIRTNELTVGDNVELYTGEQQGTARQFTQRPIDASAASFAFFDPNSVKVNVLTQALQNDATGVLTFDIGTQGERGITVVVDWGDSNPRRFQQIDGLSADTGYFVDIAKNASGTPLDPVVTSANANQLQLTHLYLQQDVLNSQENGRNAATSPFNVRFAVRYHESIVVQSLAEGEAATVNQNGVNNTAVGGVLSSTDNPLTQLQLSIGTSPALESGTASFIIPALTIPLAFVPVRDVIPELETTEVVIVAETSVEVTSSSVETVESPTASTVTPEEFLQLRVLSPDPDGEDLARPQKLPKDILDGDKLTDLFSRLPDGAYEIEYVISEGDERSILRVNVRDGEATIPDSELDEGLLRLRELKDDDRQEDQSSEDNATDQTKSAVSEDSQPINVSVEFGAIEMNQSTSNSVSSSRLTAASRFARRQYA